MKWQQEAGISLLETRLQVRVVVRIVGLQSAAMWSLKWHLAGNKSV